MLRRAQGSPPKRSQRACTGARPGSQFRTDAIGIVSVLGDDDGTFCTVATRGMPARRAAALRRAVARRGRGRDACSTRWRRSIARVRPAAPACAAASTPRLASASCLIERAIVHGRPSPCSGAAHDRAHRQAARDRQRALRRQGQPAQHRAGVPRSGALRGDRAPGHRRARRARRSRSASRRASCATTCRSSRPSTSCSTTCWKAASTQASASTATASRCRSFCWTFPSCKSQNQETGS